MTSNYISTDIAGNVLSGNSNDNNNENYPTKLQNDIDYLNTTGDTLTGDLQMNNNKLYFDKNKTHSISYQELGLLKYLQLNTVNGLAVVDSSNLNLCQILNDSIDINKSKIKNVGDPTEETDAVNKKYADNLTVFSANSAITATTADSANALNVISDLDMKSNKIINLSTPSNDNDSVNKNYCDLKVRPNVYDTFIQSGTSIRFTINNNKNWSVCLLTIRFYDKRTSLVIPRNMSDITYDSTVRGDGSPGLSSYKYTYYGNIKITNVSDTHVNIQADKFGYNEDATTSYSPRDNSASYGIESVVIL